MSDITQTNLEAAIIDQVVAGQFTGLTYAYIPVVVIGDGGGWQLGVAVANERGYSPVIGKTFDTQLEAKEWADGLNEHVGIDRNTAAFIIISTMGGKSFVKEVSA